MHGVQSRVKSQLFLTLLRMYYREEESGGSRKEFHIFFVPRKSLLCEKRLKVSSISYL